MAGRRYIAGHRGRSPVLQSRGADPRDWGEPQELIGDELLGDGLETDSLGRMRPKLSKHFQVNGDGEIEPNDLLQPTLTRNDDGELGVVPAVAINDIVDNTGGDFDGDELPAIVTLSDAQDALAILASKYNDLLAKLRAAGLLQER